MSANILNIDLGRGLQANPVLIKGSGRPVVFLHGLSGQQWDAFQEGLAGHFKVYSPANAGSDEPDELKSFDTVHDLVIYYDDVFRKLGLDKFDLVGHSFGGMIAAEYAAAYPERVGKLVLIDALGLWRDDAPVTNFTYVMPDKQIELLVGEPTNLEVAAFMALPEDQPQRNKEIVRRITTMASMLHFIWPIAERGLSKRLYRIQSPTLILWGEEDRVLSSVYAEDFGAAISSSTIEVLPGAGHMPQFSHTREVLSRVLPYLAS